ncbi:MAG: CPBP family intramembrane metalloprotease [Bacteroidales bacterium]|nr:CPBP family intramembrane metalloprotease [Bacteroidales bacterium]
MVMPRRPWVGIVISALIFGLIHMNPVQMVYGSLYGLLLGWLFWRTGSLLPGIVIHIANNTVAMSLPESVDNAIEQMSLTTEAIVAAVSLIVLFFALRWFAQRFSAQKENAPDLSDAVQLDQESH